MTRLISLFAHIYVLAACSVAHLTPVSCQKGLDAQTVHRAPSHACKTAGPLPFLFMAVSSAQSLVLCDHLFQM